MKMNFLCFDTEDNSRELLQAGKSGFDKRTTQIAAITDNGDKFYNRGNVKEFLQWLSTRKERFFYAHNLQYDLGNLFADNLDALDVIMIGGRLIRARWKNKNFVDSFNIWPMSAAMLGKAFELEKLETDSMATDKEYVFRDVEIIRAAMLFAWQFCEQLEIKYLPATLGGLCVKVWKSLGGENCHDSNKLSRQAYYGGRVELFKVRNESDSICYTDINSLYPFVMQQSFPGVLHDCGKKLLDFGVAKVTVKVTRDAIQTLPFRNKDGRVLFPSGKFTGVWTVAELREAEKHGATIQAVHETLGTNESLRPYGAYVAKLYQARLESKNAAEKLFWKLLLNNLYGRLGSSGVITRSIWQTEKNKFDGVPYGEKILASYQMPLSEETNWSHAAYVTAYARIELAKYLRLIGSDNLIYCDTDSTIFDCPARKIPFEVGTVLGQMKLESWETSCQTYAPKLYQIGNTYKAKGVPKHLAKTFIETRQAQFEIPFKLRESILFYDARTPSEVVINGRSLPTNRARNSKKLSVWRKVTKEMRSEYDKKRLIGNRYFPCNVNAVEPY